MTTNVLTGGLARVTLVTLAPPPVNIAQVVRETLHGLPPPSVHVAALCRETLMPGFAIVRTCLFT